MQVLNRKNPVTGLEEEFLVAKGTIVSIETGSHTTKENEKPYGFFSANIDGRLSQGIAYDAVASKYGKTLEPGDEAQFEIPVADAQANRGTYWKLSFPTVEDISSDIMDFLNNR